jgi:hypothetical protein
MIIINEKLKLEPDDTGSYNLIETRELVDFRTRELTGKKGDSIISYSVSLETAINKVIHLVAGNEVKDKDVSLYDYVKIIASTSVKINKVLTEQIQKSYD